MPPTESNASDLQQFCFNITSGLLESTSSSRTTIRLLNPQRELVLVAESLAPGVESMDEGPQVDPTVYPTYIYLAETRELLIQDDCRTADIAPPPSLVEHYRVFAQMLAPVVVRDEFEGTISVHLASTTRTWGPQEIQALKDAKTQMEDYLITHGSRE